MSGETEERPSGWTVDSLKELMLKLNDANDLRYQQRYDAQTKALDAAILAQQTAVQAALLAADKGVQAALTAADRAVTKAELAAEKRFESVNEFRAQLSDQAATFLPRNEYDRAHQALADKFEAYHQVAMSKIDDLKEYSDLSQGKSKGYNQGWVYLVGAAAFISTIISIILVFI